MDCPGFGAAYRGPGSASFGTTGGVSTPNTLSLEEISFAANQSSRYTQLVSSYLEPLKIFNY